MNTKQQNKKIAKHGFINELARLCNCNRQTVRTAIYDGATGTKAELVRKMYKTNYINHI